MKTAIIIGIGVALYFTLYGAGPLEGFLKQQLRAQKAEVQKLPTTPKAEEQKSLAALKDQQWKAYYRSPPACQDPATELKKLECKNMEDNARQAFDRK